MDRMIYTAMNGAKQIMLQQVSNNHNLANVNTTGFRADLNAFRSLPIYGAGHPSRVYPQDNRVGNDFNQGHVIHTGRDLDVAINGDGFIAVQGADGGENYTRAGDFRVNAAGFLETGAGDLVLGNGGPISIPAFEKFEIATDGTISIKPLGQPASTLAAVDRIKLVNPDQQDLSKAEDGLFRHSSNAPLVADAAVSVTPGALESSNVNAIDALVNMIELSRQFEMHIKLMGTAEQTDEATASLMRLT